MQRMTVTCGNCAGMGTRITWRTTPGDIGEDGSCIARREETVCEACNGKGYTEHAVFSIEKAEVILKHCGLSAES